MQGCFQRHLLNLLVGELAHFAAVALLAPRQARNTTPAMDVAESTSSVYLGLQSERDHAGLFPVLRGLIDQARRHGKSAGGSLRPGSAWLGLLLQSGARWPAALPTSNSTP